MSSTIGEVEIEWINVEKVTVVIVRREDLLSWELHEALDRNGIFGGRRQRHHGVEFWRETARRVFGGVGDLETELARDALKALEAGVGALEVGEGAVEVLVVQFIVFLLEEGIDGELDGLEVVVEAGGEVGVAEGWPQLGTVVTRRGTAPQRAGGAASLRLT